MKKAYYLLLVVLLSFCETVNAQVAVAKKTKEGVTIYADPRLDVLIKKYKNVNLGVIRSGNGYRVQIYNGNDRNKANEIRVDFLRRFPGIRTYLTYVQPQFRVKVGDYRTH